MANTQITAIVNQTTAAIRLKSSPRGPQGATGPAGTSGLSGTWNDVTGSRSLDTNYTNTTGATIAVSAYAFGTGVQVWKFYVNDVLIYDTVTSYDAAAPYGTSGGLMIVPPGATYRLSFSTWGSISGWFELY